MIVYLTGIYEIVNIRNGKRYIGSAVNFGARWKLHRIHLQRGAHHSPHLQASWDKHGAEAFAFNRIVICARRDLLVYEQLAMDALHPEFNVAKVAGSCLGVRHSENTKRKISLMRMGNQHTLGYRHLPASIAKLRSKQLGVQSPTKGKKRDPEAVAATAAAHRGMKRSEETRRRISEAMTGKKRAPRSAGHRAKLSAALKGRVLSAETIAKISATKRGQRRQQLTIGTD